jgi:hypothetical protein
MVHSLKKYSKYSEKVEETMILDRHLRVCEDKLTNNKPSLITFQLNLNMTSNSD